MKRIIFFVSILLHFCAGQAQNTAFPSLEDLDRVVAEQQKYVDIREGRISDVKSKLRKTASEEERYQLKNFLFNEYSSYVVDSALHYAQEKLVSAYKMNRQDYIDDSRLNMAYVLIQGGMYKEASDILQNINRATLAEYLERYYFLIYNTLYEAMVKYTIIESQSKEYRAKAMLYKDSIMQKNDSTDVYIRADRLLEQGDYTIQCYHKTAHGSQNLEEAFANSCNGAFAAIGMMLDQKKLSGTTRELLYDQNLPVPLSYSKSVFTEAAQDDTWQILLTAIGQGKTQITPMHSAMITAAIANGGTLMKPYLMDHVENSGGDVIRKFSPSVAGELMVPNEADALKNLMVQVVNVGTGSALKRDSYQVAGKTGSAEVDKAKETHAWFVGFAPADDPKIAVCVIVEEGGSGGHTAAPIAAKLFDAWLQ